ncbi:MAG: hypothetical protein OQL19_18240 [Gammaproteobacteria bacterium]|nr:hypothetical protein [Gammaproteobacteria bacterium]
MNRYDKFFKGVGIFLTYVLLTSGSIAIIRHDFNLSNGLDGLVNFLSLNIGSIGCCIFWKWIKEL